MTHATASDEAKALLRSRGYKELPNPENYIYAPWAKKHVDALTDKETTIRFLLNYDDLGFFSIEYAQFRVASQLLNLVVNTKAAAKEFFKAEATMLNILTTLEEHSND